MSSFCGFYYNPVSAHFFIKLNINSWSVDATISLIFPFFTNGKGLSGHVKNIFNYNFIAGFGNIFYMEVVA